MAAVPILMSCAWLMSFVFTLYFFYYAVYAVLSLRRGRPRRRCEPQTRFALVIAARNEECVIGQLIESLRQQDYPDELYEIIVAPNNCTDDTRGAARRAGARIFDCRLPVRSKGEVLTQVFDMLLEEGRFDAACVFDADNLVDPGFLRAMNDACCAGARAAQGYRDSKNPYDTAVSGCYSIYYWMINRMYNHTRRAAHLSAMINGSGFMVSLKLLREMGGWHTVTMTEDIEFTTQCILRGERVEWVSAAVIYDEQPLTFAQSWKQRKRWSTGILHGFSVYFGRLARGIFTEHRIGCFDQMMFFLAPFMQLAYLLSLLLGLSLDILYAQHQFFPYNELYYQLFISLNTSFAVSCILSVFVLLIERKWNPRMLRGVLVYWLFLASWIPINLSCMIHKCTTWEEIRHTRSIRLSDLSVGRQ